eukprot:3443685-Pyramimonas_sp.AAC.1
MSVFSDACCAAAWAAMAPCASSCCSSSCAPASSLDLVLYWVTRDVICAAMSVGSCWKPSIFCLVICTLSRSD